MQTRRALFGISLALTVCAGLAPALAVPRWVPAPVAKSAALAGQSRSGDAERGKELYAKCQACHQTDSEAGHQVGPNLAGILRRPAAVHKNYKYSHALRQAAKEGLIWTTDFLDEYLENPTKFMPDGSMAFVGLKNEQDRQDIIAYLAALKAPEDAPWLLAKLGQVDIPLPVQRPSSQ